MKPLKMYGVQRCDQDSKKIEFLFRAYGLDLNELTMSISTYGMLEEMMIVNVQK